MTAISNWLPTQILSYDNIDDPKIVESFKFKRHDVRHKKCKEIFQNQQIILNLKKRSESLSNDCQVFLKLFQSNISDIFKLSLQKKLNIVNLKPYIQRINDKTIQDWIENQLWSNQFKSEISTLTKFYNGDLSIFYVDPFMFSHNLMENYIFKMSNKQNYKPDYPLDQKYFVNENIGRAVMARRMRKVIKMDGLYTIHVPKKRLYFFKGPDIADKNCVVVVKKLDLGDFEETSNHLKKLLPLKQSIQIQHIFHLIFKTGYQGAHGGNILVVKSGKHKGKLAIIDTEPKGSFELSTKSHALTHKIGLVRNKELDIASLSIKKAEMNLSFNKTLMKHMSDKYINLIKTEKRANQSKLLGVIALCTLVIFTNIFMSSKR